MSAQLAQALREIMAHEDFGMDAKVVARARKALTDYDQSLSDPACPPSPDWSTPQETTDQQIERIFCELIGVSYEELIDSMTDTFKSCQWFRRGYRRALASQQTELSRQDQSHGNSIGHSVSGINVQPITADDLPPLGADNIDSPLPEHAGASVSPLTGVGVVGGIAALDDLNHLAMLSELECPPDPETVDRALAPSSQELQRHAAKGRAIVKRLYNDPANTISMVSVGAWIEYADQLLMLSANSVPVSAYDRLHALNEQNAGRVLELEEALAALEAAPQQEPDKLDAERYRWLRDKSEPPHNFYISVPVEFHGVRYQPQEVDAYIDAARKAQP